VSTSKTRRRILDGRWSKPPRPGSGLA
jgi:hypothetical protein